MRRAILLVASIFLLTSPVQAQISGVDVQVSNGKKNPTVEQLRQVLPPGGFVRDVFGWQKADRACNLRNDPAQTITIPPAIAALYQTVKDAGGKNFVTLAFNNKNCGQSTNSGGQAFPNTPELRAEFAAYAVAVIKQVPAIGGVSIWNELNGTWNGGYKGNRARQLTDYCLLSNAVIAEIRKADPSIPIAIGASVGANIDRWFIDMFDAYGCTGKGDATIWLDVHPYLSGKFDKTLQKIDWRVWSDSVENIRAAGIDNPFVATEWGARAAYLWNNAHPKGSYMKTFKAHVLDQDPHWAGLMWFEMLYDRSMPNAGLFDPNGNLSAVGNQYVTDFLN